MKSILIASESVSIAASVNEDRQGVKGNLAWLIDGASPVSSTRVTNHPLSDTCWFVDAWEAYFASVNVDLPLARLVDEGLQHCRERAASEWISTPNVEPSSTLALVKVSGDETEYLVIGDSPVALIYDDHESVIVDNRPDASNQHILEEVLASVKDGYDFASAKARHLDKLAAHRQRAMNHQSGYWVLSRSLMNSSMALSGTAPTPERILLASDGFSRAIDTFALAPTYGELLRRHSLQEIAEAVRASEKDDPECLRHPRWSVSDDCSAVLLEVHPPR